MPTILITGASSGIGRATALRFQTEGWNVIATMREPSASDLAELDNVLVTRLDVTDTASIEAAVNAGIHRFGTIDLLLSDLGIEAPSAPIVLSVSDAASIEVQLFLVRA